MGGHGSGRKKKKIIIHNKIEEKILIQPIAQASSVEDFKKKIDALKFIRIYDFALIPRYLVEQLQKRIDFDIKELYATGPAFETHPLSLIYVLADEGHKIKGFFLAEINSVDKKIYLHLLSVDKEYQDRGEIILKVLDFLKVIKEKLQFKAIRAVTSNPRACERLGGKKTGEVIMEI